MNAALKYLPVVRYPQESGCTWSGPGKCRNWSCRQSVMETRTQLELWDPEDVAALVDALPDTCALSLADYGGLSTEHVAALLGLPRDAVERTEAVALRKLNANRELRKASWDGRD